MSFHSNEEENTQQLTKNLIYTTELLEFLHSQGKVHGKLFRSDLTDLVSAHSTIEVQDRKSDLREPKGFLDEWRPAEEKDLEQSQAGDIFSLGCFFYSVITGGEHPFGKPGNRPLFIAKNLYDLTQCQDDQLRKLIAKMVSHDSIKRPTTKDLLKHPYLWKEDQVEHYLMSMAENIEHSKYYEKWKSLVLFSSDRQSFDFDTSQEISTVKSITKILMDIKEKKEMASKACQMFPDLLSSIYFTENPGVTVDEIDNSCPETFGNVLIANTCFGEVEPVIRIKRRHGRFGLQPVHVMQFPCPITADSISLLKRLSCLSHQNLLRYFYLAENTEKNLVLACEPFDVTLDTWMAKNSQQIKLKTAKEILTQITRGLIYYHYNNIIHGNLTTSQITITSGETITVKIAKFLTDGKESTDSPPPTRQNDVRKLGQICNDLLQRVKEETLCRDHLLRSMKDPNDECIPPSNAVFYHPFFWSPEEMADFLLVSGDFYEENPAIDMNSSLNLATTLIPAPEFKKLTTNRSAIEYFSSSITSESTAKRQATLAAQLNQHYPMLVTQTWLRLQTLKTTDEDFDLRSYYHPIYDFPLYHELMYHEKKTSEIPDKNFHSPKDEPEGTTGTEIAPRDEGFCEEFVIESFPELNIEKKDQISRPIESYLEKYVLKWIIAEKHHAVERKMKHPAIDRLGRTAMHLACYSDDFYEPAAMLMGLDFDPNTYDIYGFSPLHVAALNNSINIGKLLIKKNALIDQCDLRSFRTPLFLAAIGNSIEMLDLLIKKKANTDVKDTFKLRPLHIAVASDSRDSHKVVELLLKGHADSNAPNREGNTPLHVAVAKDRIDIAKLLLKYNANPNIVVPDNRFGCVLHMAVVNRSLDMLQLLLSSHADPNLANYLGETPLHLATCLQAPRETRQDITKKLISAKANANAVDHKRLSVLHSATLNKVEDVVEQLLEYPHIDINFKATDRKVTPLHLAAWFDSEKIARMLVEKKANIDARDYNGETPLEYAASSNAVEVAKVLLDAGAKAKSRRWKQRSPLHIAAAHGAKEIAELLIDKGADVNAVDEYDFTPLHYAEYRKQENFVQFFKPKTTSHKKKKPPLSKQLMPSEVALIPELTNSFQRTSIQPSVQIKLSEVLGPNDNLIMSQEILMYSLNATRAT